MRCVIMRPKEALVEKLKQAAMQQGMKLMQNPKLAKKAQAIRTKLERVVQVI